MLPSNNPNRRKLAKVRKHPPIAQPLESPTLNVCTLSGFLDNWIGDCQSNGVSRPTIHNNQLVVGRLIWFFDRNQIADCDAFALHRFMAYLSSDNADRLETGTGIAILSRTTLLSYHSILSAFFSWLHEQKTILANPMEKVAPPELIRPFTANQVRALLQACEHTVSPERNRAIILLLLDTGVRVSELCAIKMRDVNMSERTISVVGKGGERRLVYFGKNTGQALRAYLKLQPHESDDPLIYAWNVVSNSNSNMTRCGVVQLFRRLGKLCGISGVRCSPHPMRHTFAIGFLLNGGNETDLLKLLGLTTPSMIPTYVRIAQAEIEHQQRMCSPADRL